MKQAEALSVQNKALLKKPDFFIVGAPKCGTTAMCAYLGQHPSIFVPVEKELNFFGADLTGGKKASTVGEYLSFFSGKEHLICGEGSPWYLYSKKAAAEICHYNPEAKIIIMLRNPVDFLYSLHSQVLFVSYENIEDFREALAAEPYRKKGQNIPKTCRRPEALLYREAARFSEQVRRYLDIFGKDQVHIILFDEFKANTPRIYRDALAFLGVDTAFTTDFRVINPNKQVRSKSLRSLVFTPPEALRRLVKLAIPEAGRNRIKERLNRANTRFVARQPMDAGLRNLLIHEFEPIVMDLGMLIGRDLRHWCRVHDPQKDRAESYG